MRKTILISVLFFIVGCLNSNLIFAQYKSSGCCIELTTEGSKGMIWENEEVKFTFKPTEYFWKVTIENKSDSKMTCLWDETLFIRNKKSSKIVFNNTVALYKNSPKGEDIIASNTEIVKEIFPVEYWDNTLYSVFSKKGIKKWGDVTIRLIFPIVKDEVKTEHEFTFLVTLCK